VELSKRAPSEIEDKFNEALQTNEIKKIKTAQ
jgi:hypothetical protein